MADQPTPITVTFVDDNREIRALSGASLRTLALNGGADLYNVHIGPLPAQIFNCRGIGLCGSCLVEVVEGAENLVPQQPTALENFSIGQSPMGNFRAKHWHLEGDRSRYRLACQVRVQGDLKLKSVRDTVAFTFDD